MRKGNYQCKRFFFYVPVAIGERIDRTVDYIVRLFGPFIVLVPEGTEFPFSNLEKPETPDRQNSSYAATQSSPPLPKSSRADLDHE